MVNGGVGLKQHINPHENVVFIGEILKKIQQTLFGWVLHRTMHDRNIGHLKKIDQTLSLLGVWCHFHIGSLLNRFGSLHATG